MPAGECAGGAPRPARRARAARRSGRGFQACSQVMPASRRSVPAGTSGKRTVMRAGAAGRKDEEAADRLVEHLVPGDLGASGATDEGATGAGAGDRRAAPGDSTETSAWARASTAEKRTVPRPTVPVGGEGERTEAPRRPERRAVGQEAAAEVGVGREGQPLVGQHPDRADGRSGRRPCRRGSPRPESTAARRAAPARSTRGGGAPRRPARARPPGPAASGLVVGVGGEGVGEPELEPEPEQRSQRESDGGERSEEPRPSVGHWRHVT